MEICELEIEGEAWPSKLIVGYYCMPRSAKCQLLQSSVFS